MSLLTLRDLLLSLLLLRLLLLLLFPVLLLLRPLLLLPTTLLFETRLRAMACLILRLRWLLLLGTKAGLLLVLTGSGLESSYLKVWFAKVGFDFRELGELENKGKKVAQATESVVQKTHSSATMRTFYLLFASGLSRASVL